MKFIMHRNKTVASVMGLAIAFEKGVPMQVPPYMYQEVLAAGGVSEDELVEDEVLAQVSSEPSDPGTRKNALFDAFDKIVLRNTREEFTGAGIPHAAVLTKELGWAVNAKERDAAWIEFKVGKSD